MEKRVTLCVMLLGISSNIFPALVLSSSPQIKRFFEFPQNDTLKKGSASTLIGTFGCDGALRKLGRCPADIYSCVENHIYVIKRYLLVQVGSTWVEAQVDKLNLIILESIKQKRIDIIKVIIEYLYTDQPAICLLAGKGYTQSCISLLENGENINRTTILGKTPLMCAAHEGRSDTVQALLTKTPLLNVKSIHEKTAVELARENGYDNIALTIIDKQIKYLKNKTDRITD